jgi:hypothetical protein
VDVPGNASPGRRWVERLELCRSDPATDHGHRDTPGHSEK